MCATCVLTVWSDTTSSDASDEAQHVELACGELGHRRRRLPGCRLGEAFDQPPRHSRSEERTARGHDSNPGDELLFGRVLEQEPARAGSQRLVDVLVEIERREHEHARRLLRTVDDPARRLDAVDVRHADVHEHDIWMEVARERDRLCSVRRLADDVDVGLGVQDHPEAAAHESLVVREQDANRHRVEPSGNRALSA